jgi:hypothetical protein
MKKHPFQQMADDATRDAGIMNKLRAFSNGPRTASHRHYAYAVRGMDFNERAVMAEAIQEIHNDRSVRTDGRRC